MQPHGESPHFPFFPSMNTGVCRTVWVAAMAAALAYGDADASEPDDNVEWFGISHFGWEDRRPLCPVDGQAFDVQIHAFRNDLTAVRVHVDDGSSTWIDASVDRQRGPYDVWLATIPATASTSLDYYVELTDGADTDYYGSSGMSETVPPAFVVDFSNLLHAPYGATVLPGGGVVFRVWSPGTSSAFVRGEFNEWGLGTPMSRVGEDWIARAATATAGEMYKFYFDGSVWNSDARARRFNPLDNNNTFIVDAFDYSWQTSEDFDVPDFEEMVIYQLHVGTFAGLNDPFGSAPFPARYIDVANRADHMAELGVNCVQLMPVTEFPGDESAGYNPVTAFAPEWKYGTPNELKALVDELHARGIAVTHDIVWNHFSFSDNYLWNYDGDQIYFDDPAVETPWGAQADFDNGNVRQYFLDSAHQWLDEFRMDGFRMDATDFMNLPEQEASGWSLMQALNDQVDNRWADKFIVAEQLPDDPFVTRPTSLGGAGFDAQYFDYFTDELRQEIFDAAVGDPEMSKIQSIINGGGAFLNGRYVVNYVELHDEVWPTSGGQRIVRTIDTIAPHDDAFAQGRSKLAQGVVFTAPGTPAIFMGTEWLEDQNFGTGSGDRIDWSHKTTYSHIFKYYQDLIALRTSNGALRSDSPHEVYRVDEAANVIAFQRFDFNGNVVAVIANFSNNDYLGFRVGLPQPNEWEEVLNSQSTLYGGSGIDNPGTLTAEEVSWDGHPWSIELDIPAMGLLILRHGSESTDAPVVDANVPASIRLRSMTNPMTDGTDIRFALQQDSRVQVQVIDAQGRLVAEVVDRELQAGEQSIHWDGLSSRGERVASGVYSVVLRTPDGVDGGRLTVLR